MTAFQIILLFYFDQGMGLVCPPTPSPPPSPSPWTGVSCSGGRVDQLQLEDNDLVGDMPDSFWSMTYLASV